jgi:hypothetical protein
MTKNRPGLKHLVSQIKKLAAPPPAPPPDYVAPAVPKPVSAPAVPTAPTPAAPAPVGAAPAHPMAPTGPQPDIAKMQQQLQGLARDMTQQVNLEQLAGPNKQIGADMISEQQQALGRMSFADFITRHYTRNSDVPAVELDWDPSKTERVGKDPSKPTRTNVVMDTMTRVGNPKSSEFKIDGDWGFRTNASIRNSYAFAFGLLKMAEDFKYQPRTYNWSELSQFKTLIPHDSKDISQQEKIKLAKNITDNIMDIRRLFHEVEDHILNKTGYSPYIEGTQPYATYTPGNAPDPRMVAELSKKFTNMRATGNVEGRSVTVPIGVGDLVSTQALEEWQKKNLPNTPLLNILSQIKQHLDETDPGRRTS